MRLGSGQYPGRQEVFQEGQESTSLGCWELGERMVGRVVVSALPGSKGQEEVLVQGPSRGGSLAECQGLLFTRTHP